MSQQNIDGLLAPIEKRSLRYDFSAVEINNKSLELANKYQLVKNTENAKKSANKKFSSDISGYQEEISVLSDHVANGYEFRDITCDVKFHWPAQGMKTLTRQDTKQKWAEKMTDSDWNLWNQYDEKNNPAREIEGKAAEITGDLAAPSKDEIEELEEEEQGDSAEAPEAVEDGTPGDETAVPDHTVNAGHAQTEPADGDRPF